MKCACCGNGFDEFVTNHQCDYCGFLNTDSLVYKQSAMDLNNRAAEYRMKKIKELSGISVNAGSYRYDSDKEAFVLVNNVELFDKKKTGADYFGRIVWSLDWIANPLAVDMVGVTMKIPYEYVVNRKKFKGYFSFIPKSSEGVECHLGLKVDSGLRLNLYMGNSKCVIARDTVSLKWINDND